MGRTGIEDRGASEIGDREEEAVELAGEAVAGDPKPHRSLSHDGGW